MKLEGLRVIDLSVFLPGPSLTLALADHGAEVIKVEQPGEGDPTRHIGPKDGETTVYFRNLNRGKKSIVLDLKSSEGRESLLRLAETADVFLEAFRPGVMTRLGIDYAAVRARNPRIVYCSISAFGQEGPYKHRPAHDLAVEALSGGIGLTLGADDKPAIPGVAIADMVSSLQSLAGIMMALYRRTITGKGDYLDMTMHDSMLAAMPNVLGPTIAENRQPIPKHERTMGGSAFYQIYETQDGRHLVLGGQEMKFVNNLLEKLGRPDFAALCEPGPGAHQKPLIEFLRGVFITKPLAEWIAWMKPLDVCFAPVNTLAEALADENALNRGMVLKDEQGRRFLGPAIKFLNEPARPSLKEPGLGQHTAEVLGGLQGGAKRP